MHVPASSTEGHAVRRLPVGAEVQGEGGVDFRVWAPAAQDVAVILEGSAENRECSIPLAREESGYWSGLVGEATAGRRYRYRLGQEAFPDPASRFQPEGPHGASEIVDPGAFVWSDRDWRGVEADGQIIYEMHVGTFTREGTWGAALAELPALAELGVTVVEMMPVADFPGRWGWGYDGVDLFAPTRLYGSPDDLRRFVDGAHALGLGVILDAVYNHLGPDGNFLASFSPHYFSTRYESDWGRALNFDGEDCGPVRELFLANAAYWIAEFHFDGLRLDATQQIFDASERHLLREMSERVRAVAPHKAVYFIAENEPQDSVLVRPAEHGGYGLDAMWNDDFHHTAIVALTGKDEAYYTDYRGTPQEFVSAAKWGFLYQGQRYKWQRKRRGTPSLDLEPPRFVNFLQNHDQIANSLWGRRIHNLTSQGRLRALTALLLLGPSTPMLFQGQEFGATAPFLYFADHHPELARAVAEGREKFLRQFPSIATDEAGAHLPNPEDEKTFRRCKLDPAERERHGEVHRLHCDLIRLRKSNSLLMKCRRRNLDGAVLGVNAFLLRYFGQQQDDRLLVVNLGVRLHLDPAPEPLLAPPSGCEWKIEWSSEDPSYGGAGTPALDSPDNWQLPAEAAVLLAPVRS
jgi:maltooligosyltrehalose trehalohydrolase